MSKRDKLAMYIVFSIPMVIGITLSVVSIYQGDMYLWIGIAFMASSLMLYCLRKPFESKVINTNKKAKISGEVIYKKGPIEIIKKPTHTSSRATGVDPIDELDKYLNGKIDYNDLSEDAKNEFYEGFDDDF